MQMSFQIHPSESILAQCLIQHNCHRIAKIQRPNISKHRNADAVFFVLYQYLFRDTCAFFSEHNIAVRLVFHIGIYIRCFGRRHIDLRKNDVRGVFETERFFVFQLTGGILLPLKKDAFIKGDVEACRNYIPELKKK